MRYLFTAILVLSSAILAYGANPCKGKDFGKGSVVCVCDSTYCDDLDPVVKTAAGVVTLFETSLGGDRFKRTDLKFGDHHSEHPTKVQNLTIDRTKHVQKIVGFGGSFTDATGYTISTLPEALQKHIIDDYFSAKGVEYNLNRLPIGGADFSRRAYSYDDGHDGDFELKQFALTDEDKTYKIPYMKLAKQVSPHTQKFFGSPWSAPAWMKNNSELNHGGYLKGNPGEQYYKAFAKYFVKFLDAYKAEGLDMWGVTIENEPSAGNQPKYEFNCLGFTKEIQKDFLVKDLGPALSAAGYGPDKLQVMIFDDQRDVIHEWAQYIFSDKEAAKLAAGTAFHWYQNNPQNIGNLKKALDADPTKFIINSEASVGVDKKENPNLGDWGNGLENTVRDIIDDLNNYVAGWVNWNMALDLQGGPNWAGLKAYAPILIDAANKIYYKQPAFYALGHISKFILPDSYKLDFKETTKIDRYQNTAAVRADGGVVVVIMNSSDDLVEINIEDAGQKLSHYVKPHTLQTYIYWL